MATKQRVNIEGIEFDALLDLDNEFTNKVPSYPVEKGYEVSDGIINEPQKLSLTLLMGISVTFGGGTDRIPAVEAKLKALYYQRQPVTVTTSDNTYKNMAIESISFQRTAETGYTREIPISFKEVIVTESQTVMMPASYGRSGTTGENAGTASTNISQTPAGTDAAEGDSNGSVLYNLTQGGGLSAITGLLGG